MNRCWRQSQIVCRWGVSLLVVVGLVGCGSEKQSLYEEEHAVPEHWPSGLIDAANKLDERLLSLQATDLQSADASESDNRETHESQLRDLVEWIPEVAADTDLSEPQWLPIYELCELMREHLSKGDVRAIDIEDDFARLQTMLREAEQKLAGAAATNSNSGESL
ncbi:MAG: hypothetical protein KDA51_10020 [Planctomycetales bacterium]|nr:hypothetical protein [Planctomycetales bacterium]MCA9181780.1 hypothetical protein [Planctomycetales bacterium]